MNKLIVCFVLAVAGSATLGVAWLISNSEFTYPHPSGERVVVTDKGVFSEKVLKMKQRLEQAEAKGLHPKAVVAEISFDFGTMNPLTTASHTFYIRNEGEGPLQVHNAGTTCKCTLSKLSGGFVPPGEKAEVTLTWTTGHDVDYFHGATITTNDPDNRRIQLTVHGTVRTQLAATRSELDFAHIEPDRTATVETLVYSQMFSAVAIRRVNCSMPGMTWEILPPEGDQLAAVNATSGQVLRVTTPSDLRKGKFQGVLQLEIVGTVPPAEAEDGVEGNAPAGSEDGASKDVAPNNTTTDRAAPPDGAKPSDSAQDDDARVSDAIDAEAAKDAKTAKDAEVEDANANDADTGPTAGPNKQNVSLENHVLEVTFSGSVGGRMSLTGSEIDSTGTVDFGVLSEGDGKKVRLLMKIYDKQCEIPVKRVDVKPEFVKVSITPYGTKRPDLYFLELEVPKDAPQCHYLGKRSGKLRIEFDHPRIDDLELNLSLAIAPRSL